MVVARRDELALVFKHLLQNALAHGGGSLERIEIRGHVDGDQACIQVRDDGSGFDVLDETAAFDLFRQGHGSSTSAGAGLGLSLCRRIVERHDGAIEAIPSAAEGATFEIRLPAANPGERVLDATEASAVGRSELSGSGREGAAA